MHAHQASLCSHDALSRLAARVRFHEFAFGRFASRRPMGPSRWPDFDLFWVHRGAMRLQFTDGGAEQLRAGRGVLIFPDTSFTGQSVSGVSRASVHHFEIVGENELDVLPLPLRRLAGKRHGYERYEPSDAKPISAALTQSVRWASCRQTPMIVELRVAQLVEILAQLSLGARQARPTGPTDAAFERLVDELCQRLDQPMSLNDMAQRLGMSPSHFRARFRQRYNASPGSYLLRVRMMEATRLLCQTRLPIKTVARRVGYQQVNAFFRMFHAKIGYTPADYRRRFATR